MSIPDVSDRPLSELLSLRGRRALVTGGARGIGRASAHRLAEAGASVLVGDTSGAAETAAELSELTGGMVAGIELDVSDPASVRRAAEESERLLGGLDIWVNNAGIFPTSPVLELDVDDWDRVLEVNLRGAFIGAREAATRMIEAARGGIIVNVASTAAFRAGGPGVAHYVASKHGLAGLTKSLALELGPHGIRVVAVAPTQTDTPGVAATIARSGLPELREMLESFAARLPLGRMAVPDDVARVVLFCASDLASFLTGCTLPVDGGELAV